MILYRLRRINRAHAQNEHRLLCRRVHAQWSRIGRSRRHSRRRPARRIFVTQLQCLFQALELAPDPALEIVAPPSSRLCFSIPRVLHFATRVLHLGPGSLRSRRICSAFIHQNPAPCAPTRAARHRYSEASSVVPPPFAPPLLCGGGRHSCRRTQTLPGFWRRTRHARGGFPPPNANAAASDATTAREQQSQDHNSRADLPNREFPSSHWF